MKRIALLLTFVFFIVIVFSYLQFFYDPIRWVFLFIIPLSVFESSIMGGIP